MRTRQTPHPCRLWLMSVVEKKEVISPVKFLEINPSGQDDRFEYSGKIKAAQEVYMAFEIPGKITRFPVKEGQQVKKKEVLGRGQHRPEIFGRQSTHSAVLRPGGQNPC